MLAAPVFGKAPVGKQFLANGMNSVYGHIGNVVCYASLVCYESQI
jgi:hypothetical protein